MPSWPVHTPDRMCMGIWDWALTDITQDTVSQANTVAQIAAASGGRGILSDEDAIEVFEFDGKNNCTVC